MNHGFAGHGFLISADPGASDRTRIFTILAISLNSIVSCVQIIYSNSYKGVGLYVRKLLYQKDRSAQLALFVCTEDVWLHRDVPLMGADLFFFFFVPGMGHN